MLNCAVIVIIFSSTPLPADVDTDAIDAHLERGVLNVHIPKKEVETARPLPIRKIAIGQGAGG